MTSLFKHRNDLLDFALPHGGVVAEIGTCVGVFANEIILRTHPKRLHLVDLWLRIEGMRDYRHVTDQQHLERMRAVQVGMANRIKLGEVILHQGLSSAVIQSFADGAFSWVYVDADHRYESVYADLVSIAPKVCMDGFIAGHDYLSPSESRIAAACRYGVVEAVGEFCAKHNWEIMHITERQRFGDEGATSPSYVLRRRVV